ncbi:hypothetical protein [Klenkia taihuensis]|uniref:Uncharacterized protein n=1 Tax=Klenkia taihuensis TaxID=1225127 RepID=A0A1I1GE75_9ACTN|nr:hypothetical protein [Klenkia taihuensis]GHE09789.1 hypothetical protein GCM10011381_16310 [Klenkia taihuensis]SFC09871.1 hypothetical protein SAMN05661030_0101 [Klenkia taihuensis]
MDFDDVADELYAQLPADFIGARTDAVAEAKRTDKGLARRIGELGKPTLAAWTVNLLVRESGDQVSELVELGDLLRRAQDDLDPEQLRALDKQRRQVVRALAREAAKHARRAGHPVSDAVVVQVEETLKAAVADPAAAEVVLAGRLTGALTYNGIGAPSETRTTTGRPPRRPAAAPEPPPPPVDLDAARAAKADRAARREAEEKLREARTALRAARSAVDDAAGEAEQATAAAKEAARAAGAARKEREDAQARVAELEAALEQARERAAQADEETGTAEAEADRAEADRAAAEEDLQRAEADRDRAQQLVDDLS